MSILQLMLTCFVVFFFLTQKTLSAYMFTFFNPQSCFQLINGAILGEQLLSENMKALSADPVKLIMDQIGF